MPDLLAIVEAQMMGEMQRLNTVSHNLANANTPGFRREVAVSEAFGALLSNELTAAALSEQGLDAEGLLARAREGGLTRSMTDVREGSLRPTGAPLDLALQGPGYLEVRGASGTLYSRAGSLSLDARGRLVDGGGFAVMGQSGEIRLSDASPQIDETGAIRMDGEIVDRLKLVQFADESALESVGGGRYAGVDPQPIEVPDVRVRQGHIENSNVSTMHEMVQLIETMRRLESAQQVVRGYDDALEQAIRLIGEL